MSTQANDRLGRVGIWTLDLRFGDKAAATEAAAELDELGFGAIWIPGGIDGEVLGDVEHLLAATRRTTIATGIINIWKHKARDVAGWFHELSDEHKERVLLGVGVSHGPIIGAEWKKPLSVAREFLDSLDAAEMPRDRLCLAALGPKMLELSAERTAGAHPYLTTPEHTAQARQILGPGKLLAPEQGVILETDPAKARKVALEGLTHYRGLPNYRNNWKRLGFSEDEIEQASDRLIDALFAWGDMERIAARVHEHLDAGADHVCLQVLHGGEGIDIEEMRPRWRELAQALL